MAAQGQNQRGLRTRLDVVKRAFRSKQKWEDKVSWFYDTLIWLGLFAKLLANLQEEFLDVIYWMRQVVSLVAGITWGIIPLTGALGLIT